VGSYSLGLILCFVKAWRRRIGEMPLQLSTTIGKIQIIPNSKILKLIIYSLIFIFLLFIILISNTYQTIFASLPVFFREIINDQYSDVQQFNNGSTFIEKYYLL
jgi:hypothetical protein